MIVRRANPNDAAALADLALRTFLDTFSTANRPEDVGAYVTKTYGEAKQRREIESPDVVTLLVEDDGSLIAFSQVRRGEVPACVTGADAVEVARFYVDQRWHGRGAAQELMTVVIETAKNLGGATLWLGVWEHNVRAIRFYEKCGFRDAGSQPFLLGSDLQTDRVMTLVLPPRG